ncbi:YdcF family protein [Luteibaculum oceani]|uniref:YdcF family protein n=1 Tax=Luteibaculum oceani TaxID=1294296 RepID=A0A5C6V0U9_9FLAO|nr:YdcF family protein [Luteibaculum oceani]TXC78799.1 YdcF family protein [Luteibaculum oceani]
MFFVISKILHFLVKPILWVFFGGLFGAWKKRNSRKFWLGFVIISYLFSNQFLVDFIFRSYEPDPIKYHEIPADVEGLILLGGFSSYFPDAERPIFRSSSDRIMQSILISRDRGLKPVIITGGSGNIYKPKEKEAIFMEAFLGQAKLDTGQFIYEPESRNTYQNAVNTKRIIQENNWEGKKWLLVTSAFHMPRSLACFNKENISVFPFPVDHKAGPPKPDFEYILFPSVDAFHKWETLFHEWIGYTAYKLTGKA